MKKGCRVMRFVKEVESQRTFLLLSEIMDRVKLDLKYKINQKNNVSQILKEVFNKKVKNKDKIINNKIQDRNK